MTRLQVDDYWLQPPPAPSPGLARWRQRLADGWRPNRRLRTLGYYEAAQFFNVYLWEYFNVLYPLLKGRVALRE